MKEVSALIEQKKEEFSRLPFFDYLRDPNINPRQRLSFAPCAASFIMSFGELNSSVLRDESTTDPIQAIINKHTYEDDNHWVWFLEDIEKLGFNPSQPFTKTLEFLWGDETREARRLAYKLYHYAVDATPIQKLAIVEAIEATGNVALRVFSQIIQELQLVNQPQEYQYFGSHHLEVDSEHYFAYQAQSFIENIELSESVRKECCDLVERVFLIFTDYAASLLAYAKAQQFTSKVSEVVVLNN